MPLQLIRATVAAEHTTTVDTAIHDLFTELDHTQPDGVRYASTKAADGQTYVILLDVDDPDHNPLPNLPAFQRFQSQLPGWLTGPPVIDQLTVIGNYRIL